MLVITRIIKVHILEDFNESIEYLVRGVNMLIYLSIIETKENKSKFEQIYNKYKQIMFFVANRVLRDEYLSEDAVHQAFLRIIDNLDKIDKIDCHKTKGFIVTIVENIAIDFYRKRKRENNISFDEVEFYIRDIKNESNLIINDVEEAILKLPISYSSVFRLKYSQGYSNKEISEILKISEENVRQRISRGKKKLAEILAKEAGKAYE